VLFRVHRNPISAYSIKDNTPSLRFTSPSAESSVVKHAEIQFTGSSASSEIKSRGLRCKPGRVRELPRLAGAFSFDRRSYILTNSVCRECLRLISASLRLPSALQPARRASVPGLRDARRKEGNVFNFDMFPARVIAHANHISPRSCAITATCGWQGYFELAESLHHGIISRNGQIRSCDRETRIASPARGD